MSDICVTVPKNFTHPDVPGKRGLAAWIGEGDPAGEPWSGQTWEFTVGGNEPVIEPGERVYIVCEGKLRGYAPLIRKEFVDWKYWALIRGGDAVAITVPCGPELQGGEIAKCGRYGCGGFCKRPAVIQGFRGWRYRWWKREDEVPFPDWMTP